MRAPAPNNDGMRSLLTDGTARFRVWAPNAAAVQVMIDDPGGTRSIGLAAEGTTGNWSADQIPAANMKYQYKITTIRCSAWLPISTACVGSILPCALPEGK